jgi:hypothetical protein
MAVVRRAGVRAFAIVAVVAAALATPTVAGATKPTVYSVRTANGVTLPDTGGTPLAIASLTVPRGAWTVSANAAAADFGSGDFVRCALQHDGTAFDGGSTTYVDDTVADLANTGVLKTTVAATTIALVCSHDEDAASASQFTVDPGATLTAVEGGPIRGAAATTATSGPTVAQTRTTAPVPLVKGVGSVMDSMRVGAGEWVLHANLSLVSFGGVDFVNCYLYTRSSESAIQQVVVGNSDVFASNVSMQGEGEYVKPETVKIACVALETSGVHVDPGATLTATLVSDADLVRGTQQTRRRLSDSPGRATKVLHEVVPAGAWRVSSAVTTYVENPDHSDGGTTDFVRCSLFAGSQAIDGGARVLISASDGVDAGNEAQMIVESGVFTATKPWVLTLTCSHDASVRAGSHWWIVFGSPVLSVRQGPIQSSVI